MMLKLQNGTDVSLRRVARPFQKNIRMVAAVARDIKNDLNGFLIRVYM